MSNIHNIVRQINRELVPEFEKKLRSFLTEKDKEWLIEQVVRLTLDAHSLQEMDRKHLQEAKERKRAERINRLREIALDHGKLGAFLESHSPCSRDKLIGEGYLLATAPEKGTDLITSEHRSPIGESLLAQAKDILFGLLFGDEHCNTRFDRIGQELLTLTLPRHKSDTLDFMKASTEMSAVGTWQDPESVSNDSRADNVILEVEFGEVKGELIGHGVLLTLSLINNLEVNEQILYGRMINIEQSTLIE